MCKMNSKSARFILFIMPFFVALCLFTATMGARWLQITYVFPNQDFSQMFHGALCRLGHMRVGPLRFFHSAFMSLMALGVAVLAMTKAYLMRKLKPSNSVVINRIMYLSIVSSIAICVMAWTPGNLVGIVRVTHQIGAGVGIYGMCLAQWADAKCWLDYIRQTHEVRVTKCERALAVLMGLMPIFGFVFFSLYAICEFTFAMGWTPRGNEFQWIGIFLIFLSVFGYVNQSIFIGKREKRKGQRTPMEIRFDDGLGPLP